MSDSQRLPDQRGWRFYVNALWWGCIAACTGIWIGVCAAVAFGWNPYTVALAAGGAVCLTRVAYVVRHGV